MDLGYGVNSKPKEKANKSFRNKKTKCPKQDSQNQQKKVTYVRALYSGKYLNFSPKKMNKHFDLVIWIQA
jgi:hypothetical protein